MGIIIGSIMQLLNPAPEATVGMHVPHGMHDNGIAHGQHIADDIHPIGEAQHNPIDDTAPIPIPRGGQTGLKHIADGQPTHPDESAGIAVPVTPEPTNEQAEQSGMKLPQYAETIAQPAKNVLKLPPIAYDTAPQIRIPYQATPAPTTVQTPTPTAPIPHGTDNAQIGIAIGGHAQRHGAVTKHGEHTVAPARPSTAQQEAAVHGVEHIPIGTIHAQFIQLRGGHIHSQHAHTK